MPAGYDAEVAELFRDLRAATALSEIDLAGRLGTRADVVQALEQGALYALPPWAETCRVVNAYGALLNLDVRPLLRRIYAQLESGIVGLQPKTMPDVPVMTPPEAQDYSFAPSHAAGAPASNPLDIPWPPPAQQAPPPRNAWPNAPQSPQPQPIWQPAPQAPQPQHAWQNAQSPQGRPGSQPQPQAQRPNVAPQRQAPPQQQAADRRAPPPRAPQAQAPQPQAQPRQMPPRQAPPPEPSPLDVDFGPAPLQPTPEPEKPRRRARLLKWGLGVLIVSVVAFGLWMTLTHAPGPSGPGAGNAPSGTLDPDDPRSRKADRLPSPF